MSEKPSAFYRNLTNPEKAALDDWARKKYNSQQGRRSIILT
jgi:hypothetical protein